MHELCKAVSLSEVIIDGKIKETDGNRCLLFSSSSFKAKSSELTSGVLFGFRCCKPYNATNSSVYRSWRLTITPASVKVSLFQEPDSPGTWSFAGTASPPCSPHEEKNTNKKKQQNQPQNQTRKKQHRAQYLVFSPSFHQLGFQLRSFHAEAPRGMHP